MTMWLYQKSQKDSPPNRYRIGIWEGERCVWPVRKATWGDTRPALGDLVVLFYAKSGGPDPGFYGWAVIIEWCENTRDISFQPISPSDHLKMKPWWDDEASNLANRIRGTVKRGTLWKIEDELVPDLRAGIRRWTNYI